MLLTHSVPVHNLGLVLPKKPDEESTAVLPASPVWWHSALDFGLHRALDFGLLSLRCPKLKHAALHMPLGPPARPVRANWLKPFFWKIMEGSGKGNTWDTMSRRPNRPLSFSESLPLNTLGRLRRWKHAVR